MRKLDRESTMDIDDYINSLHCQIEVLTNAIKSYKLQIGMLKTECEQLQQEKDRLLTLMEKI